MNTIIPTTNKNLEGTGTLPVHYGIGLLLLMSTMIGPQCNQCWVMHPIDAFKGSPLWFGCWCVLAFTNKNPPAFADLFWVV